MLNPQLAVLDGEHLYTAPDLVRMAEALEAAAADSVAVHVPDGPLTAAALMAVQRLAVDSIFLPAEIPPPRAAALAQAYGCSHLATASGEGTSPAISVQVCGPSALHTHGPPGRIGLLTSGTTGEPKRINHTWESLLSSVAVRRGLRGVRWLCLYPLTRFAGFNTMLHALFNNASLIVSPAQQPGTTLEQMRRARPTHASGTPTSWRNLLMIASSKDVWTSLRQITLGGEVVDQTILSALKSVAPHARITHVYASTELGVCLTVSDGLAGFPVEWLNGEGRTTQLQIRDNELWIKRHKICTEVAVSDGWSATGDMVEVKDGRIHITGRRTDVLNVGGAKVLPGEVEQRMLEVPGVLGACVSGRRSSLSGTVLVVNVLAASGVDQTGLRALIFRHCRSRLPRYAVPRIIQFVESLPVAASGKTQRGR